MNGRRTFVSGGLGAAFGLLLALSGAALAAAPSPMAIELKVDRGELVIRFKGRKLLVYAFATNQFKPYVRELYTLRGDNVLRDAVPDHLHHHGLMYAVCVNGVNFWEEMPDMGVQKHIEMPLHLVRTDANGLPVAQFVERLHWLAQTNRAVADSLKAALLLEERTLTLTVDEQNQEVALCWESRFRVGPKVSKATLHGPNYDGLGLRLPESFNRVARFHNSANQPYVGPNTQNVIPARWTSVSGLIGGREVMLVLFGRPDNATGDASFFTMVDPFAYLSATQALDRKPLKYDAGERFRLSYLLTVHAENKSPEFIRHRCQLWEKERR